MRSKIFIALVASAIGMSSCDWFKANTQTTKAFGIQGKWEVDSIVAHDSMEAKSWLSLAYKKRSLPSDTLPFVYDFKDKQVIANAYGKIADTSGYQADDKQIKIKGKEDSVEQVFAFTPVNDTAFFITSKDSSVVFFKRAK